MDKQRRQAWSIFGLTAPTYIWLTVTVLLPLTAMLYFSFLTVSPMGGRETSFTLKHYVNFFEKRIYWYNAWRSVELVFLSLATVYSFVIPLKGTISLLDFVVLVAIFAGYVYRISQAEPHEPECTEQQRTWAERRHASDRARQARDEQRESERAWRAHRFIVSTSAKPGQRIPFTCPLGC